jgi:hypothetical protein
MDFSFAERVEPSVYCERRGCKSWKLDISLRSLLTSSGLRFSASVTELRVLCYLSATVDTIPRTLLLSKGKLLPATWAEVVAGRQDKATLWTDTLLFMMFPTHHQVEQESENRKKKCDKSPQSDVPYSLFLRITVDPYSADHHEDRRDDPFISDNGQGICTPVVPEV